LSNLATKLRKIYIVYECKRYHFSPYFGYILFEHYLKIEKCNEKY